MKALIKVGMKAGHYPAPGSFQQEGVSPGRPEA